MASNLSAGIPQIPSRFKFSNFEPDADPITPGVFLNCSNIYPTSKGFRSYPSLQPYSVNALNSPCLGAWAGYIGNAFVIMAGTANQLFLFNPATLALTNQGQVLTTISGRWRFDSYGTLLIAVNGVDPARVYNGATMGILGGSPPIASIVQATDYSVFLILSNSATWRSSLSATLWTPSIATQTVQGTLDATDGNITAAHKLRSGITLFKKGAFHFGSFIGPPFYWEFKTVSEQVGVAGQEAVANLGDIQYWPAIDNFYKFDGYSLAVLPNNLKEWFFDNLDGDNAHLIAARWDQRRNLIFWHFPSIEANPAGALDQWICFNTRTEQWAAKTEQLTIEMPVFTPINVGGLSYQSFVAQYPTYGSIPFTLTYGDLRPQNQNLSAVFGTDHTLQVYSGTPGNSFLTTHFLGDRHNMFMVSRLRPQFTRYPATGVVDVFKQYIPGVDSAPTPLSRPLSTDGWFNIMSTARLQQFKQSYTGDFEIVGLEAMCDYVGER